jgi:UDP-N-acetyl-D-mannosaminuronic acid dehydrogenase
MPLHVAELTVDVLEEAGQEIEEARVAVLGYAYLENSDDTRNSPSITLINRLEELGAEVVVHDPWVREYQGDLSECVRGCDAIVVMVAHDVYRAVDLGALRTQVARPVLVDGRNVFSPEQARSTGWVYRGVGYGKARGG